MPNYKVDMAEILAFEQETKQLVAVLDEQIGDVKASIDQIKQMDSFQGQAADDAKAYFEVMHRNLLPAFQGVFSQLEANITKHVRDFQEEIDTDPHAVIETGYIEDEKEMIEDRHDALKQLADKVEHILNSVSDITAAQAPSPSAIDEDEHDSVQVIKKLSNKFDGFSTSYRSDEEQIESTLVEIKRFMNRRVQIGAPDSNKDFADFLPKMREHLFEARENDSFNHVLLSYEDRTFQKKPAYDFSEYDKTRANNYWVLSKNGITDQEAAKATVAYNEALKNGEIKLEGPEPDVDIGVEQILAAKDGYDYFTGKEISKIQSATIIFGVVSSGFSWRGSRRFSLSKMQVSKIKNNVKTTSNSVNGKINNKATVTKDTGDAVPSYGKNSVPKGPYREVNGFPVKVKPGAQEKHIPNTPNYKQEIANGKNKSIFYGDNKTAQELLDKFAGKGQLLPNGKKERVDFGKPIGKYYDLDISEYLETTRGMIHYGKNGAHIVPSEPLQK
ncbi:hypothetical protein Pryu01_02277 [Paraliobacillus ryukyuensis]